MTRKAAKAKSQGRATAKQTPAAATNRFWLVLRAYNWSAVTVGAVPLAASPDGPCRFVPVFETREQAIAFEGGSDAHVIEAATLN